jgi:hypothetical protein
MHIPQLTPNAIIKYYKRTPVMVNFIAGEVEMKLVMIFGASGNCIDLGAGKFPGTRTRG